MTVSFMKLKGKYDRNIERRGTKYDRHSQNIVEHYRFTVRIAFS